MTRAELKLQQDKTANRRVTKRTEQIAFDFVACLFVSQKGGIQL